MWVYSLFLQSPQKLDEVVSQCIIADDGIERQRDLQDLSGSGELSSCCQGLSQSQRCLPPWERGRFFQGSDLSKMFAGLGMAFGARVGDTQPEMGSR